MSSHELTEWKVYEVVEPFGEARADLRAGIIAATVANFSGNRAKGSKALSPLDFMPLLKPVTERDRRRETRDRLRELSAQMERDQQRRRRS